MSESISAPMGQELPPLPPRVCLLPGVYAYNDERMEQYARAAIAPYADRIHHLERELKQAKLQQIADIGQEIERGPVGSIDTPEFQSLLGAYVGALEAQETRRHIENLRRALIAYIDGRSARTAWISIKDRLPEHGGPYLVASTWGVRTAFKHEPEWADGCFQDVISKSDEGTTDFDGLNMGFFHVTHWMPLPAAPAPTNTGREEAN